MKNCPRCNKQVDEHSNYCLMCGYQFLQQPIKQPIKQSQQTKPKKKMVGKYKVKRENVHLQILGNVPKCRCGNDTWDIIRNKNPILLLLSLILLITLVLAPIGILILIWNKNIRACSKCESIYYGGV